MEISKFKKFKIKLKWWMSIFPVGFIAVVTSPFVAPIAGLIEFVLPKNNPLWWWLDDEIESPETNSDWLEHKEKKGWFAWLDWHCFRNSMWNLKASIKPEQARVHCVWNEEEIVDIIEYDVYMTIPTDGDIIIKKDDIYSKCLNMPNVRWIDKYGNDSWQTSSGIKVNLEKTFWGKMHYWYLAKNSLYYRKGYVKETNSWGVKVNKKFPFIHIGKYDYYIIHASGWNEKRAVYTHKRQLVPEN